MTSITVLDNGVGTRASGELIDHRRDTSPSAASGVTRVGLTEVTPSEAPVQDEAEARLNHLVAQAVRGEQRAIHELLATVRAMVLPYCRARLGRQQSAIGSPEDVAQDVCLAVLTALDRYQFRTFSFKAFVYGIAAHKVIDSFRAAVRDRSDLMPDIDDTAVDHDGPEQRVLQAEQSKRLGRLLTVLSDRQREILVLRVGMGLSAAETAEIVQSTPGAVRVLQHRALVRLRDALMSGELSQRHSATAAG
jgi:RNA polymerase sigma-70 factor, ECF subfamily